MVGCGTIAYWQHLRNLKRMAGVRIAGLVDPDPGALARAARLVDAPHHADADALLARDDVDAVVIASPAGMHGTHVRAARDAGKHLYVEKPLAHDSASLATVRDGIAASGTVAAVGYNLRFHPACRRLRDAIGSGTAGTVRAIYGHFTEPVNPEVWPAWRRERSLGGGVLLDLASHHFDFCRWLLRDELSEVRAGVRADDSAQNSASVRGVTRGGVDVGGYFAYGVGRSHALVIHGTRAVLQLDVHGGLLIVQQARRFGYGVRSRVVRGGVSGMLFRSRKRLQPSYDPSHALALRAFIAAIRRCADRDPDLATLDDGAAAVRAVLEAEGAVDAHGRAVCGRA